MREITFKEHGITYKRVSKPVAINDFYNLVNSFEYYNCTNAETGKSANFYLAEERRS